MVENKAERKTRTILGLILLYIAILLDWEWVWGILFLIWVIPDLISGVTYFLEPIKRETNPILFWIIIGTWIWIAIFMILAFFFPELDT